MKLYMILYAGIKIGMIAGPLPYGMEECISRAEEYNNELQEAAAASTRKDIDVSNWVFRCEERDIRPEIEKGDIP